MKIIIMFIACTFLFACSENEPQPVATKKVYRESYIEDNIKKVCISGVQYYASYSYASHMVVGSPVVSLIEKDGKYLYYVTPCK